MATRQTILDVQNYIMNHVVDTYVTSMESQDPDYMTDEFQAELDKQVRRVRKFFNLTNPNGGD
jgi:hypothetical protein